MRIFIYVLITTIAFLSMGCDTPNGGDEEDENKTQDTVTLTTLKKTCQSKSYDEKGQEVKYGTLKDDGYYQAGVAPHYTRDSKTQVVTDLVTKLEWQDDEKVSTPVENTKSSTKIDVAAAYCANLPLDGGGWRLPTFEELAHSVVREKARDRYAADANCTDIDPFKNVCAVLGEQNAYCDYLSSTALAGDSSRAWTLAEGLGYEKIIADTEYPNYVRCVRARSDSKSTSSDLFSRDDKGVVTDKRTQLQWQDDYSDNAGDIKQVSWQSSFEYCESLALDGGGWRVPNFNELFFLADRSKHSPSIDTKFFHHTATQRNEEYITSTSSRESDFALYINFDRGDSLMQFKHHYDDDPDAYSGWHIRCVRPVK